MSPDFDVYNKNRKLWSNDCNGIINILIAAAKEVFDEEKASSFILGVTEREIEEGILKNFRSDECFWLKREIRDLDLGHKSISRYKDTVGEDDWALRNARLFDNLEMQLKATLPASSIETISVDWSDNAIDPYSNPKHRKYTDELCEAFETRVEDTFNRAAEALSSEGLHDRLLAELAQHTALAQAKCKDFYGREDLMKKIKSYLLSEKVPKKPLLISGTSGSGKTTVIARTMKEALEWRDGKVAIVTRFIGTTRESSRVGTVLASMTRQIQKIYGQEGATDEFQSFNETCIRFTSSLSMATGICPLVVLLDSFEQLDPLEEAMNLAWIPIPLPLNVKIIISCLEEGDIKNKLTDDVKPIEHKLEGFSSSDAVSTLKQLLKQEGRCLTNSQLEEVGAAFARCSLPLFVRLTLQEALRWKSFSPPADTRLKATVQEAVRAFFQRIEQNHGRIFTSHALAYITLARRGLSESELEDILSCDDEVLNEVFSFWVPPIRRLPPLILVRLKNDLDLYIAQREIDNSPVLLWNHQLFKDVAHDMYCSDVTITKTLHENLADFFSGKWSDCEKPFKDRDGKDGSADRRVTAQPVMHGEEANLRKLNCLPWHFMQLQDFSRLNEECLFNIDFLTVKMKFTSVRSVIDDFTDAMTCLVNESKLYGTIRDTIQISQKALFNDVNELPTQLLNRLVKKDDSFRLLLDNCRKVAFPILICDQQLLTSPGGNLQHSFPSHQGRVVSLDLTQDGYTAVTYGKDRKVMIWDVRNGSLVQSFDTGDEEPIKALLAYDDQDIVVVTNQSFSTFHRTSGKRFGNVTFQSLGINVPAVCVAGNARDSKTKLHVHNPFVLAVTNDQIIKAGARTLDVKHMEKHRIDELSEGKIGQGSICVGFVGYIAVTDEDRYQLQVFSLKDFKRLALTRVYPAFELGGNVGLSIEAMCFSKEGDCLFVSNWRDGNILCLDVKDLKETSRLSGDVEPYNFRVTKDEGILYFPSGNKVVLRDKRNHNHTSLADHPCRVLFCATKDFNPLVTVGQDSVIRLFNAGTKLAWPATRSLFEEPENMIQSLCLFRNPRYALALKVATDRSRQVLVQDLLEDKLVRCATCKGNLEMEVYEEEPGNVTAIVRGPSGKLSILDLEHMTATRLGLSTKDLSPRSFRILKKHDGIVAVSSGGDSINIYDLKHNKKEKLPCEKENIANFQVNETETVLAVATEDGSCIVYNLEKQVRLFCLKPEDICPESPDICDFLRVSGVTNDGKLLVLETAELPKIWNIKNDQASSDLEIYWDAGEDIELSHTTVLPGNKLLAATNAGATYVFDIQTGHTLAENSFHRGEVRLSSSQGDTYLTYGEDSQDQVIAVWSKTKMAPMATFTSDQQLDEVTLSEDGKFVVGCLSNPAKIVTWHVQDLSKAREKCMDGRALFRNEVLDMNLKLDEEEPTEDRYSTDDNLESEEEEGGNLDDFF
ncbi:NACHT domain- and WD repeat-containing protein 1-like [Haliotis rubra]|uniref:NACHT domain- and WD repeat-containing protein 1-like n=1 Tax=Haliotis rubra TaxID=36100 RepID=UPI001EE5BEE9|nr:NACHT domain- and WD repeat-containing protein 1-like [Haliotis rubra]